ncbi:MAG: hypothetical protein KDA88_24715 [Planctomycetaceae bacterium]|nr:hypothetical protein [Planctomycetaceae bacterium]MCB9951922.1 hypothetical protein [Planctomycetaceae bacterium]
MFRFRPAAYVALLLYPAIFRALPFILGRFGLDISVVDGAFLWGLTPVFALGMFSTAHAKRTWEGFLLPLAGWLLGDLIIRWATNEWGFFYPGWYYNYLGFVALCASGLLLRKKYSMPQVLGVASLGSVVFFLVSNFGSWICWDTYPHTAAGLVACYAAGLPFIKYQFVSTLIFSALCFSPVGRAHLVYENAVGTGVDNEWAPAKA